MNIYPRKGTPEHKKAMEYQLAYRAKHFRRINLLLVKGKPEDEYVFESLNKLPKGTKTEFIKNAIEKALREKFGE